MSQQTKAKLSEVRRKIQALKRRKGEWPQIRHEMETLRTQAMMLHFEIDEENKIRLEDYPTEANAVIAKVHERIREEMNRTQQYSQTARSKRTLQSLERKVLGEWRRNKVQEKLASGEIAYPAFDEVEEESPRRSFSPRPRDQEVRASFHEEHDEMDDWEAKSMISESSLFKLNPMDDPKKTKERIAGEINRLEIRRVDVQRSLNGLRDFLHSCEVEYKKMEGDVRGQSQLAINMQQYKDQIEAKAMLLSEIEGSLEFWRNGGSSAPQPSAESKAVALIEEDLAEQVIAAKPKRRLVPDDEIVVDTRNHESDEEVLQAFRAKQAQKIEVIDLVESDEERSDTGDENETAQEKFLRVEKAIVEAEAIPNKTFEQQRKLGKYIIQLPKYDLMADLEKDAKLKKKFQKRLRDKNPKKIDKLIRKIMQTSDERLERSKFLNQYREKWKEGALALSTAPTEDVLDKLDTQDEILARWDKIFEARQAEMREFGDMLDQLQALKRTLPVAQAIPTIVIDESDEEAAEDKGTEDDAEEEDEVMNEAEDADDEEAEDDEEEAEVVEDVPMGQPIPEEWLEEKEEEKEDSLDEIEEEFKTATHKEFTRKQAVRGLIGSLRQNGVQGVSSEQANRMIMQVLKTFVTGPSGDLVYESLNNMHGVQPVIAPPGYDFVVKEAKEIYKACQYDDVYVVHAALEEFGTASVPLKWCLYKCVGSLDSSSRMLVYLMDRARSEIDDEFRVLLINRWIMSFGELSASNAHLQNLLYNKNMWWTRLKVPEVRACKGVAELNPGHTLLLPHSSFYRSVDYSSWKPKERKNQEPALPLSANLEEQRLSNQVSKMYVLIRSSLSVFATHMNHLEDKINKAKHGVVTMAAMASPSFVPRSRTTVDLIDGDVLTVIRFAGKHGVKAEWVYSLQ